MLGLQECATTPNITFSFCNPEELGGQGGSGPGCHWALGLPQGWPPRNQPGNNYANASQARGSARGLPGLWPAPPLSKVPHSPPASPLLPQSYTPTVFERHAVNLHVKGKPVHLQIWDTAGECGGQWDRQGAGGPAHSFRAEEASLAPKHRCWPGLGPPRNLSPLSSAPVSACLPIPEQVPSPGTQ